MKFTRVKLYQNGKFTSAEECYAGNDHQRAMERFKKIHPCAARPDCSLTAETIDSDDPKWKDYFNLMISGK